MVLQKGTLGKLLISMRQIAVEKWYNIIERHAHQSMFMRNPNAMQEYSSHEDIQKIGYTYYFVN